MASCKEVLVSFVVFALLLALSCSVSAQQAKGNIRQDLQDPVWEELTTALSTINARYTESATRNRATSLFSIAAYDVVASYSYRMDGLIVGGTMRRPFRERTLENQRTAVAFATYRVMAVLGRIAQSAMDDAFTNLRLNSNNTSLDVRTPIGLGNVIAQKILESSFLDEHKPTQSVQTPGFPSRRMISHWTPYVPVNTPYGLRSNTKWQPLEVVINNEFPTVQVFFADMLPYYTMFTGVQPQNYSCPVPTPMLNASSPGYKQQTDRILTISASLNDVMKMKAEGVDNNFGDDGFSHLVNKYNFRFEKQVMFHFAFAMSLRDSLIACIYWKRIYDTIRPVSIVRWTTLYNKVRAWGGPYRGTVDINAIDFRQYNERTDPSPEYPSGACAYFSSWSTVASSLVGTDFFGFEYTFEKGSSRIEPGLTPANTTVIRFPKFGDMRRIAMEGREAGGVHFQIAVEAGSDLGQRVGVAVYRKLVSLFKVTRLVP